MPAAVRAAVACAAWLTVAAAPAALADDARIVGVRVGYDGILPPERWSPVWVTIQPGDKPQSLQLTATYEQDPTQQAVMTTPVTTTPGRSITVPLLVCPPQGVARLDIELSGGGRGSRVAFARAPRQGEQNLLPSLESGALVIGSLGQHVPAGAITPWNQRPANSYNSGLDRAALVALRPADIGETWAALDGLNVLIARTSGLDLLPAPSLDAIARWVTGGGRLVLIADSPGDTWRRFTPPGVRLADLRPVAPPPRFDRMLAGIETPALSLTARTVTIDGDANQRAWRGRQRLDDGGALIASGPFGGGFTVIAGFDPALASASLSDRAVTPIWASLLDDALPDRRREPGEEAEEVAFPSFMVSSGDGSAGSAALSATVDAMCDVAPVPSWVYAVIVLISGLLALVVSLGDFVVLGRLKARHRSWITASAWIALFGLVAWVLPNIVRRQATTLGRAVVVDVLPAAGARGSDAAWRSGVTAIFSATSSPAPLSPKAGGDLDGYWRGFSVLGVYSYRTERETKRASAELPLVQRVSALDGASAASLPTPRGIPLRQWTLRTLADSGPTPGGASGTFGPGGRFGAFTVTGLPAGTTLRSGAVQTSRGWAPLALDTSAPPASGAMRLSVGGKGTADLAGWHKGRDITGTRRPQPVYYTEHAPPPVDGAVYVQLDGARRRTAAFDALAAGGSFAVVHLLLDGPSDTTTTIPHSSRGVYICRIAVPLTEPDRPSLQTPANP